MSVKIFMRRTVKKIQRGSPTILSVLAVGGVIVTAVQATRDYAKMERKIDNVLNSGLSKPEKVITIAECFLPTAALATGTITCILGANALNKRNQAMLMSALESFRTRYGAYRQNVIDRYGEEVDKEIEAETIRKFSDFHAIDFDEPDIKMTFMEPIGGQKFEAYERTVMDAEYHYNRNYVLGGVITYNSLMDMFGLQHIPDGDDIGWCYDDGILWVDFSHRKEIVDGEIVYVIDTDYAPDFISKEWLFHLSELAF